MRWYLPRCEAHPRANHLLSCGASSHSLKPVAVGRVRLVASAVVDENLGVRTPGPLGQTLRHSGSRPEGPRARNDARLFLGRRHPCSSRLEDFTTGLNMPESRVEAIEARL